jgi:hypothetical protein
MGSIIRRGGTIGRGLNGDEKHALQCRQKAQEVGAMIPGVKDHDMFEHIAAGYARLTTTQETLAKQISAAPRPGFQTVPFAGWSIFKVCTLT